MKKWTWLLTGLLAVLAIGSLCSCGDRALPTVPQESAQAEATVAKSAVPAEIRLVPRPLSPPPKKEKTPAIKQPKEFVDLLALAGKTPEELETQQLVIVVADETKAKIYGFQQEKSGLWKTALPVVDGYVGKKGVTDAKKEGDGKTPLGQFPIPFAFGVRKNPGCLLDYRQVTKNSCWVDDPKSVYYNQWVEGTAKKDWKSAEQLIDYKTQYAYAFVIGYNQDPCVSGAGSAIFFHCGTRATAGCVATGRETVLTLLNWLDPAQNPEILITRGGRGL